MGIIAANSCEIRVIFLGKDKMEVEVLRWYGGKGVAAQGGY